MNRGRYKSTLQESRRRGKKEIKEKRITQTQMADVFFPPRAANMMDTTLRTTLASVKDWGRDEGQEP